MKYINMKRRSGKTAMLICASYVTDYPIIAYDKNMAHCIEIQAKEMGVDVIVFSLQEFLHSSARSLYKDVLLDEFDKIADLALTEMLGANVVASTMSIPQTEIKKDKIEKENDHE